MKESTVSIYIHDKGWHRIGGLYYISREEARDYVKHHPDASKFLFVVRDDETKETLYSDFTKKVANS